MDLADIEISSADQAAQLVRKHGFAIWRGLVPTTIAQPIIECLAANISNPAAFLNTSRGVLSPAALPKEVDAARLTPEIDAVFRSMLGDYKLSWPGNCGVLFSATRVNAHVWHQDASVNEAYAVLAWVALTHCGRDAPGLSMALHNPGKPDLRFFYDRLGRLRRNSCTSCCVHIEVRASTGTPECSI